MISGITGKASFTCSKCGEAYSLEHDDFDFNAESGSEKGMGVETQYVSEHEFECDECGQEISIKFEVWEYPVGAINHTTHSATGANNVESEFDFIYSPEEPSEEDENNRVVGAVAGGAILGASLGGPVGAIIGGILGGILGDSVNKSKKEGGKNG
jgi:predicted RNA-binding Zn-ribbon protein involved in translation (DUF1610 family)